MTKATRVHTLLKQIAQIRRMERGTLCRMAGRPQYNHQTWRDGRNVCHYIRPEDVPALREAIEGYRRFLTLAQQYADIVIRRTRAEGKKTIASRKRSPRPRGRGS